jgi:hypothetical protein
VRTFAADAKGEVTLVRETQKQTVYPLMMHGVPGYAFVACAEAPGHASAVAHWTDDESSPLDLALPAGSRPCERGAIGPQKPGAATVQGIEAKNGEWIVELGLARETKLAVGAKLGPLEVVEVTQRSGNDAPVHFAIVRAKGDGASVHYRDAFTIE